MSTIQGRSSKIVLYLSVLFALTLVAPLSLAEKDPAAESSPASVVIADYFADGSVVHVNVKNLSRDSRTVYVTVEAMVGEMRVRGCVPVTVFGNGSADAVVGFSGLVGGVESVGMVEEGQPI